MLLLTAYSHPFLVLLLPLSLKDAFGLLLRCKCNISTPVNGYCEAKLCVFHEYERQVWTNSDWAAFYNQYYFKRNFSRENKLPFTIFYAKRVGNDCLKHVNCKTWVYIVSVLKIATHRTYPALKGTFYQNCLNYLISYSFSTLHGTPRFHRMHYTSQTRKNTVRLPYSS